jgi:group I intron endonuclease
MQCIYLIKCNINQKLYVGSTIALAKRWSDHLGYLKKGTHQNPHLQRAWNKYGCGSFSFSILEVVEDFQILRFREHEWISRLDTMNPKIGYNINGAGADCPGRSWTEEQRVAQSERLKGRKLSIEHRTSIKNGLLQAREKRAYLSAEQAVIIYARLQAGERELNIAKEYKVSRTTICDIARGRSFSDITGGIPLEIGTPSGEQHHNHKITNEIAYEIKKALQNGSGSAELARKYNISISSIGDIKYERTWKHIRVE